MYKLKKEDFYYGAILSTMLSKKVKKDVTLLNENESRAVYKVITNNDNKQEEFILFMKYVSSDTALKSTSKKSWQVSFTENDIDYWTKNLIDDDVNPKLVFLLGDDALKNSEIIILERCDMEELIFSKGTDRKSLSIIHEKGSRYYRIPCGGGRKNDRQIPTNRVDKFI